MHAPETVPPGRLRSHHHGQTCDLITSALGVIYTRERVVSDATYCFVNGRNEIYIYNATINVEIIQRKRNKKKKRKTRRIAFTRGDSAENVCDRNETNDVLRANAKFLVSLEGRGKNRCVVMNGDDRCAAKPRRAIQR